MLSIRIKFGLESSEFDGVTGEVVNTAVYKSARWGSRPYFFRDVTELGIFLPELKNLLIFSVRTNWSREQSCVLFIRHLYLEAL
jgi:hypothetical protein